LGWWRGTSFVEPDYEVFVAGAPPDPLDRFKTKAKFEMIGKAAPMQAINSCREGSYFK